LKTDHKLHGKVTVIALVALLALTVIMFPNAVLSETQDEEVLSLECNKDTYVDEANSDTNYGSDPTMLVKSSSSGNARAFFGFPFDNIPFGAVIVDATLIVNINQSASSLRKFVVHRLDQPWDESTATWNDQPWWAQDVDTISVSPTATQMSFDVTKVLREYASMGWPLTGFVIRDECEWDWKSSTIKLASKENPSQSGAVINITISYAPDFMVNIMPDWTNGFAGDTLSFNYLLASLNQWEGTVSLAVEGADSTMTSVFDSSSISLSAGEGRFGSFTIATTLNTPPIRYNLRVNATGTTTAGDVSYQISNFVVEINPMVLLRDLPYAVQNNTIFPVTIDYYSGTIDAVSFVIEEQLPEYCSLVETATPGELNITMPTASITSYTWNTTGNSETLKLLIANTTVLGTFSVTYYVQFAYTGNDTMPTWLNFNRRYTYLQTDGNKWDDNTLGDQGVEIPIGLPGNFDDDGRIDDWEIIEAIGQWIRGMLSDTDLLSYIQLWQTTSIEQPPP
jgi:hypothetical protein